MSEKANGNAANVQAGTAVDVQAGDTRQLARPSARKVRDVVQAQGKALQTLLPAVQALSNNDRLTRGMLESHAHRLDSHEAFEMRTLWERLRWLVTGR